MTGEAVALVDDGSSRWSSFHIRQTWDLGGLVFGERGDRLGACECARDVSHQVADVLLGEWPSGSLRPSRHHAPGHPLGNRFSHRGSDLDPREILQACADAPLPIYAVAHGAVLYIKLASAIRVPLRLRRNHPGCERRQHEHCDRNPSDRQAHGSPPRRPAPDNSERVSLILRGPRTREK